MTFDPVIGDRHWDTTFRINKLRVLHLFEADLNLVRVIHLFEAVLNLVRVIHLFEADFNLLLSILWGRRMLWNAEVNEGFSDEQGGSRAGQGSIHDVVMFKTLTYQLSEPPVEPVFAEPGTIELKEVTARPCQACVHNGQVDSLG
jgi:hypothetical protein